MNDCSTNDAHSGPTTPERTAPNSLPVILQRYITTLENAKTLSVEVSFTGSDTKTTDTARIIFERPNRIRIEQCVDEQMVASLVSDGYTLWRWDHKGAIKVDAPPLLSQIVPNLVAGNAANQAINFLLHAHEIMPTLPQWQKNGQVILSGCLAHHLRYIIPEQSASISLLLDDATGLPTEISIVEPKPPGNSASPGEQTYREYTSRFLNYTLNQAEEPDLFAAHLPSGVIAATPPPKKVITAPARSAPLFPGIPAPDFLLTTLDGRSVSLSEMRGRVVLLDFWASWCGPCTMAMPEIQALHEEVSEQDLTILSINTWDTLKGMQTFLQAHPEYTSVMLFDPSKSPESVATSKYRVTGIPTLYLIDRDGLIASSFVGYSPDGLKALRTALAFLGLTETGAHEKVPSVL